MKHTACYIKDYPRPQFVRKSYELLNGEWDFKFDPKNEGELKGYCRGFTKDTPINVPFAFESPLSRVGKDIVCEYVWYQKKIRIPGDAKGKRVLLNFEGVDHTAKLYINGQYAGAHEGAYHRFTFDITDYLTTDENLIVLKAEDSYALLDRPRGKQRWKPNSYGCWYIQTTGIWKSVWMEWVNSPYIESVKITPDMSNKCVTFEFNVNGNSEGLKVAAEVSFDGTGLTKTETTVCNGYAAIKVCMSNAKLIHQTAVWTPACPNLYDVEFSLSDNSKELDRAGSYFGLRSIDTSGGLFKINDKPYYQKLILDQGYWQGGHLTPENEEALFSDIDIMKQMGFNGARKHQKIEDERYLYYADISGFLVWVEMPSPVVFSDNGMDSLFIEWSKIVKQNYNHPSVVNWVIYNESWGIREVVNNKKQQSFTEALYHLTKSIDNTRPVISNDGWEHTVSDILSIHNYEQNHETLNEMLSELEKSTFSGARGLCHLPFANGYNYNNQPVIITEYGGAALRTDTTNGRENGWGYGNAVKNADDLVDRFEKLTGVVQRNAHFCGYCYTQLSDVQHEKNGLLTEKRALKTDIQKIREINDKIDTKV